jgi:hypothetical protein
VAILKVISEYIHVEKKKEEALKDKSMEEIKEGEVNADALMNQM